MTDFKPFAFPPRSVNQGQTDDNGFIKLLGVNATDIIYSSGYRVQSLAKLVRRLPSPDRKWLFGEANIGQSGKSRLGNEFKNLNGDNLELTLKSPAGDFPFVARLSLGAAAADLHLDVTNPLPQLPTLDQSPDGGATQNYAFAAAVNGYQSQIGNDLAGTGELKIWAVDDSAAAFFVDTHYKTTPVSAAAGGKEIFAYNGSARVSFDIDGPMPDRAAILTSRYPIPRNGLLAENLQAGETQAVAFEPTVTLSDDSRIQIRYADSDLGDLATAQALEGSLRIFLWDPTAMSWGPIGGNVDTAFNEVTANITQEGAYAAFTAAVPSSAPCGDFDASGIIDITDAVYLISYIFASGPKPQDAAAGDVDCSGRADITDAVYMINFIFAGGVVPCAACF